MDKISINLTTEFENGGCRTISGSLSLNEISNLAVKYYNYLLKKDRLICIEYFYAKLLSNKELLTRYENGLTNISMLKSNIISAMERKDFCAVRLIFNKDININLKAESRDHNF